MCSCCHAGTPNRYSGKKGIRLLYCTLLGLRLLIPSLPIMVLCNPFHYYYHFISCCSVFLSSYSCQNSEADEAVIVCHLQKASFLLPSKAVKIMDKNKTKLPLYSLLLNKFLLCHAFTRRQWRFVVQESATGNRNGLIGSLMSLMVLNLFN